MSNHVLIVESDSTAANYLRSALESSGFVVEITYDAKGSIELIRRERPQLIVMAVELATGQNGYILCGKLKKDDELKHIPIIIIGAAEGFAQHRKLKTRADEYEGKPCNAEALVAKVGGLIGFPETDQPDAEEVLMSLSDLVDDDELRTSDIELGAPPTHDVSADLEMSDASAALVDAVFETSDESGTSPAGMAYQGEPDDEVSFRSEDTLPPLPEALNAPTQPLAWEAESTSEQAPRDISEFLLAEAEAPPPPPPDEFLVEEPLEEEEPRTTISDRERTERGDEELEARVAELTRERDEARAQLALMQAQHEETQTQLEMLRQQLSTQGFSMQEELEALRSRMASLDDAEQRQQKVREALSYAMGLLDETAAAPSRDLELIRVASGQG